jgi:hypothetical protein
MAWQGDFGDSHGNNSIILEALTNEGLHIWHAYLDLPGANNDLIILDRSPLI